METFTNNLLRQIGEAQIRRLPSITEEKEVCEMCGRELDEEELKWAYEFDGGHKWCGSCFEAEKCQ